MKRIVLAGGPGTGKSSVIKVLGFQDYNCMEESFREILAEQKKSKTGLTFQKHPLQFSEMLFHSRVKQYERSSNYELCFFDRSLVDILAYLDMEKIEYPQQWEDYIKANPYSKKVLYFPFWEDIYEKDQLRVEDISKAKEIDQILRKTYINLGYELIEIPKLSVKKRVAYIKSLLKDQLA